MIKNTKLAYTYIMISAGNNYHKFPAVDGMKVTYEGHVIRWMLAAAELLGSRYN
jgi:hypothetical protein